MWAKRVPAAFWDLQDAPHFGAKTPKKLDEVTLKILSFLGFRGFWHLSYSRSLSHFWSKMVKNWKRPFSPALHAPFPISEKLLAQFQTILPHIPQKSLFACRKRTFFVCKKCVRTKKTECASQVEKVDHRPLPVLRAELLHRRGLFSEMYGKNVKKFWQPEFKLSKAPILAFARAPNPQKSIFEKKVALEAE